MYAPIFVQHSKDMRRGHGLMGIEVTWYGWSNSGDVTVDAWFNNVTKAL